MIFQHNNLNIENSVYAIINDVTVEPSNAELELLKQKTLNVILSTDIDLMANGAINQGYVEILKEFGQDKLVPAGFNVVKLIRDRQKFPTINTVVDAYNVVVAKSLLAIGVHDLDKIIGEIKFDYAHRGEKIPAVNMKNDYYVNDGDYVYRDSEKILAWLDVGDTDLTKITNDTKNIILTRITKLNI